MAEPAALSAAAAERTALHRACATNEVDVNHPYRPDSPIHFPETNYEKNLDLLGVFHYVAGGLIALGSCFSVPYLAIGIAMTTEPERFGQGLPTPLWAGRMFIAVGAAALVFGWTMAGLVVSAGRCLRQRRGHRFCLVVAALSCLSVPVGTVLGVFTLVLLTKPHVRMLFEPDAAAPPPAPPVVRPWLLAVAGIFSCGLASFFAASWIAAHTHPTKTTTKAHSDSTPPDTREERSRAAFRVAPGPIPLSLPLMGPQGVDADGYPAQYVDRTGLRSLLHFHKFKALDSYIEQFQAAFEANPRKEFWPVDAGEAFASAESELNADLDFWVASSPESFAAHFARGCHRVGVMLAMRGHKFRSETPDSDFRAMDDAGRVALNDLEEALKLRPRLVAAMRQEMRVAFIRSDKVRLDDMRDRAVRACPGCLQPRATYLRALTPRWGGSYEAIKSFVATSPLSANPRLRVLSGYEDFDRAELFDIDDKYDEALVAIGRAMKAGEYWEYLVERAKILRSLERFDEALADLNRADQQRPMHPAILALRAHVQRRREQFLPAGRDLLATLRVDPSNEEAKEDIKYVLNGVLFNAQRLEVDHDHGGALEAAELGLDLGPKDKQAHGIYTQIVLGDAKTPERVAELQKYVASHPGEFQAVRQLDYALERQSRFPEILLLWNAYLALHPTDGRAYMERSGTYFHLGKIAEDRADSARACELGISEGCERAAGP
jgi:tetratricopeptide (TPR) repeat protein